MTDDDDRTGEMTEDEIDERESAEAEALARALERGHAADELPEEALRTAALLRYSADGGALDSERSAAILEDVLESAEKLAARRKEEASAARAPWLRWALGAFGLAAAAALIFFLVRPTPTLTATPIPPPSPELVGLTMDRLQSDVDAPFERQMRDYRGAVLGSLAERYEAR